MRDVHGKRMTNGGGGQQEELSEEDGSAMSTWTQHLHRCVYQRPELWGHIKLDPMTNFVPVVVVDQAFVISSQWLQHLSPLLLFALEHALTTRLQRVPHVLLLHHPAMPALSPNRPRLGCSPKWHCSYYKSLFLSLWSYVSESCVNSVFFRRRQHSM